MYFGQASVFYTPNQGEPTSSVRFRYVVGDGITSGEEWFKQAMQAMSEGVQNDVPLRGIGRRNHRVLENKPFFMFVSLCPRAAGIDERVYNTMAARRAVFNKLIRDAVKEEFWAKSEKNEVSVTHCSSYIQGHPEREIGFFRPKEGIEKVKTLKLEYCVF